MSSERDNLMAALCLALLQRNEKGRTLRRRQKDSLADKTHQIYDRSAKVKQNLNSEIWCDVESFIITFIYLFNVYWDAVEPFSWPINKWVYQRTNKSIYATNMKWKGGGKKEQQTMPLLWCDTTVAWTSGDKWKSLDVGWDALLLCTSELTLMTLFINHVIFYWAGCLWEREKRKRLRKKERKRSKNPLTRGVPTVERRQFRWHWGWNVFHFPLS